MLQINDLEGVKSKIQNEIVQLNNLLLQTRSQIKSLVDQENKVIAELNHWATLISFEDDKTNTIETLPDNEAVVSECVDIVA